MRIIRLRWPAGAGEGPEAELSSDQARHGVAVLRLAPGAAVEMAGPLGLAPAVVSESRSGSSGRPPRLSVRLTGPWAGGAEEGPRLALALIQPQRFDWAVEKAAELGASALWPLVTERVKKALAGPGSGRLERWRRLAEEARKQCGRPRPLEIGPGLDLAGLTELPGPGFFLSLGPGPGPGTECRSPLLAVGPEGGFSPGEERILAEAGFAPWNLGRTVLRTETAAVSALSILNYTQSVYNERISP